MRVLLSSILKDAVRQHSESQGELAARVGITKSHLSQLMHDQVGIGLVVRPRIVRLGRILGLNAAVCFREVAR
jgi:transcriptional regulator with XRE-family HTH domain